MIYINQVQRAILVLTLCISGIFMATQSRGFDNMFAYSSKVVAIHNVQQNSFYNQ